MGNRKLHVTAARSTNLIAHFGRRLAMHRHSVNRVDAIAKSQPGARSRRVLKSCRDVGLNRIADGVILDGRANAKVLAALIRLQLVEFFLVEIVRMWIECPQRANDGRLVDVIEIQLIPLDVVLLNHAQRLVEILFDSGDLVARVVGARAPDRRRSGRSGFRAGSSPSRTIRLIALLLSQNKSRNREGQNDQRHQRHREFILHVETSLETKPKSREPIDQIHDAHRRFCDFIDQRRARRSGNLK